MKKVLITIMAALTALILCMTAMAETTAADELYDAAVKLLFYTNNVTVNLKAEFSLDGEWFKTADILLQQDHNRAVRQLLLTSPKYDGTQRKNGYTIVVDGDRLYLMEVFTPGVYRIGNLTERDSILRKTVGSGHLVELGYALAGQANLLMGKDAVTEAEDGSISIKLGEDAPLLVNAALDQAFQFAVERYFGTDYDGISANDYMSLYQYNTKTEGIIYTMRSVSVREIGITVKKDANGDLQHAEGLISLNLQTAADGIHQLDISLQADVSGRGSTMLKKFEPEDYGVTLAEDSGMLPEESIPAEWYGWGEEEEVPPADNQELLDRISLEAMEIWAETGYDMRATTGVGTQWQNGEYVITIDDGQGNEKNTWYTADGRLIGFQAVPNEWQNADLNEYDYEGKPDAKLDQEAQAFMMDFLKKIRPELAEQVTGLIVEWVYTKDGTVYVQYGGAPTDDEGNDVLFVVRTGPEMRIEYFSCISNG